MSRSLNRLSAAALLAGLLLAAAQTTPAPVAADALYPGDAAGTWAFGTVCETQEWNHSWNLWYILNDAFDYVFDHPDPDFAPGQTVRVDLVPAVIGGDGLRGHLTLTGAASVTGTVPPTPPNPGDTMWQGVLSETPIGLAWSFDQQFMAIGADAPLPDGWDEQYLGVLGFEATITIDEATTTTLILAQPVTDCSGVPSSPDADTGAQTPSSDKTLPATDVTAGEGGRPGGAWLIAFVVLLAVAAACRLVVPAGRRFPR